MDPFVRLTKVSKVGKQLFLDEEDLLGKMKEVRGLPRSSGVSESVTKQMVSRRLRTIFDEETHCTSDTSGFFSMLVAFQVSEGKREEEFYERYEELYTPFWC